jgi:signal transduction histidine kinase
MRWKPGGVATDFFGEEVARRKGLFGWQALAAGADGSVWAGVEKQPGAPTRLWQWREGKWTSHELPGTAGSSISVGWLFVDRQDAVWIGTWNSGIYRLRNGVLDHFGMADGLSSDVAGAFHEDHEGNIWVLTSQGIDVFRDLKVVSYSVREGLTTDSVSSLVAGADGSVWMGNVGALDVLRNGQVSAIGQQQGFPGGTVSALFEDHSGRLWVGIDQGLWVYDRSRFHPITRPDGKPMGLVVVITEDVDHNIWARGEASFYRIRDMAVQEVLPVPAAMPWAYALARAPGGGIWIGHANGSLARYRDGRIEHFPGSAQDGNVLGLVVEPDGSAVWAAVKKGLVRLSGTQRRLLTTRNGLPCEGFYGLEIGADRSLWLYGQCGVISIAREELEKWRARPDTIVRMRILDALDGAQPGLATFQPTSSRLPDGRLWFTNDHIVQMVDPSRLERKGPPPLVHIEQVIADRRAYALRQRLVLPSLTRDIEIAYTALSFAAPQKVRFRYKLENRDAEWQDPGTRRQAFYSDLAPGDYRFRVIASNGDGVWNETGATLQFRVAPAWYQTKGFLVFAVLCVLLLAWAAYRLRVRQVARNLNARFDARLAERTRIAREIHDTLLQTIQGSRMVADAMASSDDLSSMHRSAGQLSAWLGRAVEEGREALHSLRSSATQENDLAHALRLVADELGETVSLVFSISVAGTPREMHPIVRDEIYRIGQEAIRNAYAHSGAWRLEVVLRYNNAITLRIVDDGVSIAPDIAERGREGRFGLQGMRERAARIGATLSIVSPPAGGTEITLIVPGAVAFRDRP